ncbi:unnamed protein product [Fraxinus pennsylvanica]|uniref:DUF674 family protein n=1 Tax=Fraxinus pennsylvanica TaxID=56036 RepID=A0AAD2E7L6_9LAMI|nr:unnamed protein product [Fraxinus pennsylvanica]
MSTEKKNIKPTIPLKLLVDEKKTRVLAAEATSDFVNVLLSFLTLPLGTVVRVTKNNPGSIGCMNNLMSYYPNTTCICGDIANEETSEGSQPSDPECFVKRSTMCVITDDLQVLPGNPISLVQVLCNLGFSDVDQVEELSVDVGLDEVSKLLKHSLVSKTPLTDVFLGKRKLANISIPPVDPRSSPSPSSENRTLPNHTEFRVKLILSKSQNKILGLLAREDFIDFLFSLCTVPLGSVVKLLDLNSGLGCIDNLYRTVECLGSEWLAISKNEIINAGVLKQYKCKNHPLQIPDAKIIPYLLDPRSPTGSYDFGRFMEAPRLYVVSDNLIVTPVSSPSSISFLKELHVPLNDIEEKEETLHEAEVNSRVSFVLCSMGDCRAISFSSSYSSYEKLMIRASVTGSCFVEGFFNFIISFE